jgi:hypothetical protein
MLASHLHLCSRNSGQEKNVSKNHRLFKQFPLNGSVEISTGKVPTPYHIYDGSGILIGGTVDLAAAQHLLQSETVVPIETAAGRTVMGIWVCDFTDASLGPHRELQVSFFVSRQGTAAASSHPLTMIELMTRPDVQMLCHGLWNTTPDAVAYNRELLSLNARLARGEIQDAAEAFHFEFWDAATGNAVVSGRLSNLRKLSLGATWDLTAKLGLKRVWSMARQPWVGLQILNPVGVRLARNATAESFTKNRTNLVRYFDDRTDYLEITESWYGGLSFNPQFAQYMDGFKFVYLEPK